MIKLYLLYLYTDIVSTNKKTNVTSTASINRHSVKVRDCYIFHTVLAKLAIILLLIIIFLIILLLIITIDNYQAKQTGII